MDRAVSVATSSSTTVAGSNASIDIISNEVIRPAFRPGGSILRALLSKEDVPSRGATTVSSVGASRSTSAGASGSTSAGASESTSAGASSRFNLLEGLGDDFFAQEPIDDDVIARIIDEIAPSAADIQTTAFADNGKMEIAPNTAAAASVDNKTTASADNGKPKMDAQWEDIQSILTGLCDVEETPTASLPQASPLPPTPRSHFSQTTSTPGTKHNLKIFSSDMEDHQTSGKRKFVRAGKGRKIFKPSREEEGRSYSSSSSSSAASHSSSTVSLPLTQLFSQPEHKALVRDYHNFISQVEEQIRLCEQREGECRRRLTSLTSRREEAEARVRSLLGEEAEVRAEYDNNQKQLANHRRRLVVLRGVAE